MEFAHATEAMIWFTKRSALLTTAIILTEAAHTTVNLMV